MSVDIIARGIAMNALMVAQSGGGSSNGLQSIEIDERGHLIVSFTNGTISDLGLVVGKDGKNGKVYVPHINQDNVLSWTIEDKEGEIPKPVDLTDNGEWTPVEDQGKTDYIWESM